MSKKIEQPHKSVVTFRAKYEYPEKPGQDIRLAIEFSKFFTEKPEEASVEVRLEEWNDEKQTAYVLGILDDEEAGQALLNFFLQNAERDPKLSDTPKRELKDGAGLI